VSARCAIWLSVERFPFGQPDRVHRVVPCLVQELRESGRQLRIDQELHAADSGTTRRRPAVLVKIDHMRLSRHARNEMRLYRIASDDVESTMREPATREFDDRGNTRLAGETADGRPILVVIAGDDPDFVITVFLRT